MEYLLTAFLMKCDYTRVVNVSCRRNGSWKLLFYFEKKTQPEVVTIIFNPADFTPTGNGRRNGNGLRNEVGAHYLRC